jgi:hypothetical protein
MRAASFSLSGGPSVMTLAGGVDHDRNGFGLAGGAIEGPQHDVERRVRLEARRHCQRYVAFRI